MAAVLERRDACTEGHANQPLQGHSSCRRTAWHGLPAWLLTLKGQSTAMSKGPRGVCFLKGANSLMAWPTAKR